jgi:predicted helicase
MNIGIFQTGGYTATKSIVIGVPNISLLKQWHNTITKLLQGNVNILTVSGGTSETEIGHYLTNSMRTQQPVIVLTTYSSAHKVNTATRVINYTFDIKILDEAHHLTTDNMSHANTGKTYIQMLNIPALKQLALTATIKQIDPNTSNYENTISNDNVQHFGNVIERKCLLWAIQQSIICDYVIQTIVTDAEQLASHFDHFAITEENDKRMFLSAYSALKSINDGHSHHLLIYTNCKENTLKLINYIKLLLENSYFAIELSDIYYSNYHSDMNTNTQTGILNLIRSYFSR